MNPKRFKIVTHGCRTNIYESEWLRSIFIEEGFSEVERFEEADILILNSCCVTHRAERDARKVISRFLKKENALKIITGCYPRIEKRIDLNGKIKVIRDYKKIPEFIGIKNKRLVNLHLKHTRFFLKIQEGCNFRCSYCIVPFVRGRSKSRHPDDIFYEFEKALKVGVKEIVISGTQIGDYGREFGKDLAWLIENLCQFKGDFRLRLSSLEPIFINERLVEVLKNERVCKHFHIPLQSGSEKILRIMKRPYTPSYFREKIEELRKEIKHFSLGTDVIAGFPGEDEVDFQKTVDFIKEIGFSYLHVFTYSKRPFTPAEKMEEISSYLKKERTKILVETGNYLKERFLKSLIGKTLFTLPEKEKDGYVSGLSDEYVRVYYIGKNFDNFVKVKAMEVFKEGLKGEVLCP